MEPIFHITTRTDWRMAEAAGEYRGDTLASAGFIHCSTREQVAEVANRLFVGRDDLLLLSIDEGRVKPKVVRENLEGGTALYPHIYGALNLDAVVSAGPYLPIDGQFVTPPATD